MWTQISCWMQGLSSCVLLIGVGWFSFCGYEGTQDICPVCILMRALMLINHWVHVIMYSAGTDASLIEY